MPVTKVQPIESLASTMRPVTKSRLKRFFDRPFTSRSSSEKTTVAAGGGGDALPCAAVEFEPSSVCLDNMVMNFMEESNEKAPPSTAAKIGRNRCNCFSNGGDSSDDEFDFGFADSVTNSSSFGDSSDSIKSLVPCETVTERNLLADTSKIVEKNKACKLKDDLRRIVADNLVNLGYNASICRSKWEKTSSIPAGEYEFIDVIGDGERVMIDVDFRSQFEIARSTGSYNSVLQLIPAIFVGKSDRLLQIVSIMSEAARQSLKKKGMHIPPWRRAEYMKAKWLSPFSRTYPPPPPEPEVAGDEVVSDCGELEGLELIFRENTTPFEDENLAPPPPEIISGEEEKPSPPQATAPAVVMMTWQPPAIKPRSCERGNRVIITGLASLLREKP